MSDSGSYRRARRPQEASDRAVGDHRVALVLVLFLVLALRWYVPYGGLILYPFTLLSTWVHEVGHGVTALLLGGEFLHLQIFPDASGLAHTTAAAGARGALVAAGGLLGPPVMGMLLLAGSRVWPRGVLALLALCMLASLVLWVRPLLIGTGWLTVAPLALLFLVIALRGSKDLRLFTVQLIGVLLGFDTISRMGYLFMPAAQVGGATHASDIAVVAATFGGPLQLWGALLSALSVVLLLLGLLALWARRGPR